MVYTRGAQIPGIRLPGQLHFEQLPLTFAGSQYKTYCISPFQHLQFWSGS